MGLVLVDVKTAEFNGSEVLLETLDEVSTNFWNRLVQCSTSAYYQPHTCIDYASTGRYVGFAGSIEELWGCVPPSNPACDSSYGELCELNYAMKWSSSSGGNVTAKIYMGTDSTSLTLKNTFTLTGNGSNSGVIDSEELVPYYDTPTGSANPIYVQITLERDFTTTYVDLNYCNVYYRKWVESDIPYQGEATTTFTTATGTAGTTIGTDGRVNAINESYTTSNVSCAIRNTAYPSAKEFVLMNVASGTGSMLTTYAGDNWPSSYGLQFTQFTGNHYYFIGSADEGTLITEYKGFFVGVGGENSLYTKLWNDSGTTYCNVSGHMLTCGTDGTTVALGSWVGSGTEGWVPALLTGIFDNDAGTNYMNLKFTTSSAYSTPDTTIRVDFTDYGIELWDVFKINYYTTAAHCNIGVSAHVAEWTL